jgi:hypothetical protein
MHARTAAVTLAAALLAFPALAAPRAPSTQEERDKAVAMAKLLETTPWTDEATAGRTWLFGFLSEAPDITVKQCHSLFGSPDQRRGIPQALVDQVMFSGAAYMFTHPGVGAGDTRTLLAGLEGTLAAYSAWRAHGSFDAVPQLEELLRIQADGALEAHVRNYGRGCT